MTSTREQILKALAELSEIYPDWRFGQMVANISTWAKGPTDHAIWDVEDEEFLATLEKHLDRRR
jgi:hypothetical protein